MSESSGSPQTMPNIAEMQNNVVTSGVSSRVVIGDNDKSFLELIRQRREAKYGTQAAGTGEATTDTSEEGAGVLEGRSSVSDSSVPEDASTTFSEGDAGSGGVLETVSEDSGTPTEIDVDEEEAGTVEIEVDPVAKKKKQLKENLKNLREALKIERNKSAEYEATIAEKDEQLKELARIEELETTITDLQERLSKLSQYESMVSLYGTEGFKERYYDSVDNLKKEAGKIATDYGVSSGVIEEAFGITNQRQLNEFLSNYFDTFAIQDIRGYVKEAQKIIADREQAEANPSKAREDLLKTITNRREVEKKKASETVKNIGKTAWSTIVALYSNPDQGVGLFQEKPNNKEHNELRKTVMSTASSEFVKTLTVLVNNGLQDLPISVAQAMASRYQLGEAAAHAITDADRLQRENTELRNELAKLTKLSRPLGEGSGSRSSEGTGSSTEKLSGKPLARQIITAAAQKLGK